MLCLLEFLENITTVSSLNQDAKNTESIFFKKLLFMIINFEYRKVC